MLKSLIALLFSLVFMAFASASDSRVVVECTDTSFSDLTKIQILETGLTGQYVIAENDLDSASQVESVRYSPVFGRSEILNNKMPPLSNWNGYTRTLVRDGVGRYSIDFHDECSGGFIEMSCRESL